MDEIEALRMMIVAGAKAHNANAERALAAFDRLVGKTTASANKPLFYELCAILGHSKETKYTPQRSKKLQLRLKSYSKEDMLKAAQAIANNDYMAGSSGRKYGTIDYLLRNDEKIDEWLQQAEAVKAQKEKASNRYETKKDAFPPIVPEHKRASPEAVAEAKRKLMERMSRR